MRSQQPDELDLEPAVGLKFNVSKSWVRRIKLERRELGKTAPATTRNRTPQWRTIEPQIRAAVTEQPDLALRELKAKLGTELCLQTLCNDLHAMKLASKKVLIASERERPDVTERRAAHFGLDPERLVFHDETLAKSSINRPFDRATQGGRGLSRRSRTAAGRPQRFWRRCGQRTSKTGDLRRPPVG